MRKIIGLFGMVGTGKTTISHFFEEHGWYIINQDLLGHEVLKEYPEDIARMFGNDVLDDGLVNRTKLGAKVFSDDSLRLQLMDFSYKIIINKTNHLLSQYSDKNVLIEGAFFFLIKDHIPHTHLMHVCVPEDLLYKRLLSRGHTIEWIQHVLKSQQEILAYRSHIDFVIDNSKDQFFLNDQLIKILDSLS
ncbi:MAG: dephospho-CoA kinase [Brevinema sp.]